MVKVNEEVDLGGLERAFELRRKKKPEEDPNEAYKFACKKLGITNSEVIKRTRDAFIGKRSMTIIGRWQARRPPDRHELQLPIGDRN